MPKAMEQAILDLQPPHQRVKNDQLANEVKFWSSNVSGILEVGSNLLLLFVAEAANKKSF